MLANGGARALLLLVTVCLSACDAPAEGCTSSTDCVAPLMCIDSMCRAPNDGGAPDVPVRADTGVDSGLVCAEDCGTGACIDGACCAALDVCAGACCVSGEACSFGACVIIGATCFSEDDCGAGEYCEPLLGEPTTSCPGGAPLASGRCLPRPPVCPSGTVPDPSAPTCIASCSFVPPAGAFEVEELYAWGAYDGSAAEPNPSDIRNSPIVAQMDDDDCDGRITGRDVPEIIVITSPNDSVVPRSGDLVVLSVVAGELREKWRIANGGNPYTNPAAGDIDGVPGTEIVVCPPRTDTGTGAPNEVVAYHVVSGLLLELWRHPATPEACSAVAIADVDQDGYPEVLAGGLLLNGADGTTAYTFPIALGTAIMADVDGDAAHDLEVVNGRRIFDRVGSDFVELTTVGAAGGNFALVADLDPGGLPEIVSIHNNTHRMTVWRYDGAGGVTILRQDVDINGSLDPTLCPVGSTGRTEGGGPPTASDVNADGIPDIAVAGGVGYAVFDGARLVDPSASDAETFLWVAPTIDCSSASTGSSVFDFNGDERAEVLYADEQFFRIYEGRGDGAGGARVLFETCNTNGTIQEMPIVADVDGDGQADIIVVANARYRECSDTPGRRISGVRVFGNTSGAWVRTRRMWNQHAYHITNVNDDGTIPAMEEPNPFTPGLNNFRTNRQPGNLFAAVDAVVTMAPRCAGTPGVTVTVRNLGEAVMPPGATVRLVLGTPAAPGADVGTATTTLALYPAQAEDVDIATTDGAILAGTTPVFATIALPGSVPECRTDNNDATGFSRACLD